MSSDDDNDDELTKIRKRETTRFSWIQKKLADYECFYCAERATNIHQGTLVCLHHYYNLTHNERHQGQG